VLAERGFDQLNRRPRPTGGTDPLVCEKLEGVNQSEKRPATVARMFDSVAPRYDVMNDLLSLWQDASWRRATAKALGVRGDERVLDVAAGTGTSAAPLAATGADVYALDRSRGMVKLGRLNQPAVTFVVGDAAALPFADASFDAVTVSFGLRNMPHPEAVLAELARVTRSGGRLVVCEFSTPRRGLLRLAHSIWLNHVMPFAARFSTHPASYRYLAESIATWPGPDVVARWLEGAGWHSVEVKPLTGGIVALHRGWR